MTSSTINWRTMANGITTTPTAMSFSRRTQPTLPIGAPTQTAIGKIPTAAGTGIPTSAMAGQPTTTVAGFSLMAKDGSGCQVMNGRQPGFLGAIQIIIAVGLLFLLNAGASRSESVSAVGVALSLGVGRGRLDFILCAPWSVITNFG